MSNSTVTINRIRAYANKHGATVRYASLRVSYQLECHNGGTTLASFAAKSDDDAFIVTTRPGRHYLLRLWADGEWGVQQFREDPTIKSEARVAASIFATARTATAAIAYCIGGGAS